ncbi:MAG: hypothetical protein D6811_01535 [Alphaproteobacteria bacterium]|nr:MAG: hypothetical protein D6811_01535 [Alphaproteobacteria bacterium]
MRDEFLNELFSALGQRAPAGADDTLPPAVWKEVFATPGGQAVLAEMVRLFVAPARAVPGEGVELAWYREGQAAVVLWLFERVYQKEDEGDE